MSAQEFKPGDRVEYVGHPKSGYVSDYLIGKYGTVARQENLSRDSVPVKWDHRPLAVDGVLALNIRLIPEDKDDLYVEPAPLTEPSVDNSEDLTEPEDADGVAPEPLKEGDWVQVWAQVTRRTDDSGEFEHLIRERDDSGLGSYHLWQVHPDAIVRPDAGQVPPWVKPAQCTSLLMIDKTTDLRQCTRDGDGHDNHVAYGASWKDDEAYGRVEVSS